MYKTNNMQGIDTASSEKAEQSPKTQVEVQTEFQDSNLRPIGITLLPSQHDQGSSSQPTHQQPEEDMTDLDQHEENNKEDTKESL